MSRGQQGQTFDTASGENKTYNNEAQTSYATTQKDIAGYGEQVGKFAAANPYVNGGEAETSENQQLADTASGLATSAGQALQSTAVRTGQNSGGAIAATKQMEENNQRALVGEEAGATQQRLAAETGYGTEVLQGKANEANMEDQVAAQESGASQGALNTQEQAAQTPSFMDELGQGLINVGEVGAEAAAVAYCPAKGSLFLMADGKEKRVEHLKVGELIQGIDGEPQTIEEIMIGIFPVLRITTVNGFTTRNSRTHSFALPYGGFTVASKSLGKEIITEYGQSRVMSVQPDGEDEVFNVITDGSHTYRADGVWSLGVGEDERDVTMDQWKEAGNRLAVNHG